MKLNADFEVSEDGKSALTRSHSTSGVCAQYMKNSVTWFEKDYVIGASIF